MAYDKAVDSAVLDSTLTAIADAIREKGGTTDPIAFDAMAAAVEAIEAGGEVEYETGSFVLESLSSKHAVSFAKEHDARPDMYMVFNAPDSSNKNEYHMQVMIAILGADDEYTVYSYGYLNSIQCWPHVQSNKVPETTSSGLNIYPLGTSGKLMYDRNYKWFAIWGVTV